MMMMNNTSFNKEEKCMIPFCKFQYVYVILPDKITSKDRNGKSIEELQKDSMLDFLGFGYRIEKKGNKGRDEIIECPLLFDIKEMEKVEELKELKFLTELKEFNDLDCEDEVQFFVYFHNLNRKWIDNLGTSSGVYKFEEDVSRSGERSRGDVGEKRDCDTLSRELRCTTFSDYKIISYLGKTSNCLRYLAEYKKNLFELRFLFRYKGGIKKNWQNGLKRQTTWNIPYHPNIICTHHIFEVEQKDFLQFYKNNNLFLEIFEEKTLVCVTDPYEMTLQDYLNKIYKLPESEIILVAKELLSAVKFLKENHIIHFSIKPDSIFVKISNVNGKSKICGCVLHYFCNHKVFQNGFEVKTNEDEIYVGSPFYLSPEVNQKNDYKNNTHLRDKVDFSKSDVFQVGMVLSKCCGVENPFSCKNSKDRSYDNFIGIENTDYSSKMKTFIKNLLKCETRERSSEIDGLKHLESFHQKIQKKTEYKK